MNRASKMVLALLNTLFGAFVGFFTLFAMAWSPMSGQLSGNLLLIGIWIVSLIGVVASWVVAFKHPGTASLWLKILSFSVLIVFLLEGGLPYLRNLFFALT